MVVDASEALSQGEGLLNTGEIAADNTSDVQEDLAEESIEFESHFSDGSTVAVDQFPFGKPGTPIVPAAQELSSHAQFQAIQRQGDSIWAPFQSQQDWEVARWAKTRCATSEADGFLEIPGVCVARSLNYYGPKSRLQVVDKLELSYHTIKQLDDLLDNNLPQHPSFRCKEQVVGDERLKFYYRDVLECIRLLFGDPQYAKDLVFAPERQYTSQERKSRLYHEMYVCDWWWTIQVRVFQWERSIPDFVKGNY